MLEPPDIAETDIIACLQEAYGLAVSQLEFLPLGADVNSAVYRMLAGDEKPCFLKLRRGALAEIGVSLPYFLHAQGILQVIAPLINRTGQLWCRLEDYWVILYPFVQGRNGFEVILSAAQWHDFGTALQRIHTIHLPEVLASAISLETYSSRFRDLVKAFLTQAQVEVYSDPVANKVAALLQTNEAIILDLIQRADCLARRLQAQPVEFVLCHTDTHAGNLLVDEHGLLYIVDWDAPLLAPKERDLMFIGGAQGFRGVTPQEEEMLFYRGYGSVQINQDSLAYYRYERIIQDIAAFCEQLLWTVEGGQDRQQSLSYLASNFLPGNTIEVAYHSDKSCLTY